MAEEITDEERLQIVQHYLLSSPPCQFNLVLADVRQLLPAGLLTDALATGIARVYNSKTQKVVTAPSGLKVTLCTPGEVDPTHYIDPSNGSVFGVDHISLETTDDPVPFRFDDSLESSRTKLQSMVSSYLGTNFVPEDSGCGVYSKNGSLIVTLSSERPNLRNFWSGKWSSVWTIENHVISGEMKIHAHYFEDGNVQLQASKTIPKTPLPAGDVAEATIAFINENETAMRTGLDELFKNLNTETLRAMRRTQTVQRTKMEWNVNSVRMIRQVRK